jgi:hypothetical protein
VCVYPEVVYAFDRELEMVFETRPGVHATRGTIAYATSTADGVEPLALGLRLPASPCAHWS